MKTIITLLCFISYCLISPKTFAQQDSTISSLVLKKTIYGKISPKSIVHNGHGLFFAQNMFYNHSVTVYNRNYQLIKTISDKVKLSEFGITGKEGDYLGSPVEAAFSDDGQFIWITNYRMSGNGYYKPSYDTCITGADCEKSFIYKINTSTFQKEAIIEVGCVPKYIAVSPDNKYVLVSNWCSGTVSVIDAATFSVIKEVFVGRYPRGIAIDSKSMKAYVCLMGTFDIAVMDLKDLSLAFIKGVGSAPRHLCISPDDNYLYASINGQSKIVKIDLATLKVVASARAGKFPRSMVLSKNGELLYVVNYKSHTISKIRAKDFKLMEEVNTAVYPIGIAIDDEKGEIWVAGYMGTISVFHETVKKIEKKTVATIAAVKETVPENDSENYTIIVGSFLNPANAEKYTEELSKKGFASFLVEAGDRYRVGVGEYRTKSEALTALARIRIKIHQNSWVTRIF
jgi:YVTN family beta-propeller protein